MVSIGKVILMVSVDIKTHFLQVRQPNACNPVTDVYLGLVE